MSSKTVVSSVLEYLKKGKILGSKAAELPHLDTRSHQGGSIALKYKSYNPSLIKNDFVSIVQDRVMALKSDPRDGFDRGIQVIKCRDHKYFQFQDSYVLLFKDQRTMKRYYQSTSLARINNVRVKFNVLPSNDATVSLYSRYVKNLESAFESREAYFESIREENARQDISKHDLAFLQKIIKPIEERSALIWNLPIHLKPHDVMDKFWFYDMKHCFKLYWDEGTGKTLHYVGFHDPEDCLKLKNNFHGVHYDDDTHNKLLIETLS